MKKLWTRTGKLFSLLLATCTAFTACNEDEMVDDFAGEQLRIAVGVNQGTSRASITGLTLDDDSQIGVTLVDETGVTYQNADYKNVRYTAATVNGTQQWNAGKSVILSDKTGKVYAYYPYAENIDVTSLPIETETQTDYMYATPVDGINDKNPYAGLTMNHALANVKISLLEEGYTGEGTVTAVSIKSKSFGTGGTLNTMTGTYTAVTGAEEALTDAASHTLGNGNVSMMVVPTGVEGPIEIELTVDGKVFKTKTADLTMTKGSSYNFSLVVRNTKMEVSQVTLTPWIDVDEEEELVAEQVDDFKDAIVAQYYVSEAASVSGESRSGEGSEIQLFFKSSENTVLGAISRLRIDGEEVTPAYTHVFKTPGYHTVEVLMKNTAAVPGRMFENCTSLKSVNFPKSVSSFGTMIFWGCSSMVGLSIDSENPKYETPENSNAIIEKETNTLVLGCNKTQIPNTVLAIGNYAFQGLTDLSGLVMPNSVKSIGYEAFRYARNYSTQLWQAEGLETIANGAFEHCPHKDIILPDNIRSVGDGAFRRWGDSYIEISSNIDFSMSSYGDWGSKDNITLKIRDNDCPAAWANETGAASFNLIVPEGTLDKFEHLSGVNSITEINAVDEGQYVLSADRKRLIKYKGSNTLGFVVPDGVESIYTNAFREKTDLKYVQFPASLKKISPSAFYGCTSLEGEIVIPESVESIGQYAFYKCIGLTSVNIPNSVQEIGKYAFYDCAALASVSVGNGVRTIGDWAFAYCEELVNLTLGTGITTIGADAFSWNNKLANVNIPNSVTEIGEGAFNQCSGLQTVSFGSAVQTIGKNAFSYCTALDEIILPNTVETVGQKAFSKCTGLTAVTIGTGVKEIGTGAFSECTKLQSIKALAEVAPALGTSAFSSLKENGILTVPVGKTEVYAYWMTSFFNKLNWTMQEATE